MISSFECTEKKISYPKKTKSIEYILKQMILKELWQLLTKESDNLLERAYVERKIRFLIKELIYLNQNCIEVLYRLELLNTQSNLFINNQQIQLILSISNTISEF
jgi:hypothetical protein